MYFNSLFVLLLCTLGLYGQQTYRYTLDLKNCQNDQVKVVLQCPKIAETSATFIMPYVIPGSYAWKEYGRFLQDVKGFDAQGAPIPIKRKKNLFYIAQRADKLARLEYFVQDTWDDSRKRDFVFQPGGSNIEQDKNFVINHHAFEGYFEGYKNLPFEVEILHPAFMYGSTWSTKKTIDKEKDLLLAKNYFELVDNPVMYCTADTASFLVDSTRIHISSYSTNKAVMADSLRHYLQPLAYALRQFIGKLPVKEYYFLFYFASPEQVKKIKEDGTLSGYGALEHHHCSFYFLPESKASNSVKGMVQDIAAHEFLHILSPLNLHSKEISDFDFKDPRMSQHLWLYEGVTEYLSWLVRVQTQLATEQEFIQEMRSKLERSEPYGLFSFTEMSKNVLKSPYKEKYNDVYSKGALLAMCLDLVLLKDSEGKTGLKHLVQQLMKKYGSERAFDDDSLFLDISNWTSPRVEELIERQIKKGYVLPLADYLADFGYTYAKEETFKAYFIAFFSYQLSTEEELEILQVGETWIDLRPKDVILEVNGKKVTAQNYSEIEQEYFRFNRSPQPIAIKIRRNGTIVTSTGTPVESFANQRHVLKAVPLSTKSQVLHDAWLKGTYAK